MSSRYLVATTVSIDEVSFPDGCPTRAVPGSAGFFAMAGLRVYTDDVLIIGGIGPEYLKRVGGWYAENRVATNGLIQRGNQDVVIRVTYFEDGSRIDRPSLGLDGFHALDPTLDEVSAFCGADTRGIYVFKALETDYLDGLLRLREQYGCRLIWEISGDACVPENVKRVEDYMSRFDIFTINNSEAAQLYGVGDEETILSRLERASRNWIFYRCGSRGAYMLANGRRYFCHSITNGEVVDVTGAGNASSAATLYGLCGGYGPQMSGFLGCAAAAEIIAQYGVPQKMDGRLRARALENARRACAGTREG